MFSRTLFRTILKHPNKNPSPIIFAFSVSNYQPPPSQLQQFTHHISKIHEDESFTKAAELMATLQADQDLYRKELEQLQERINNFQLHESVVVNVVRKRKEVEHQLRAAQEENEAILQRCNKQIENIKVYGVSRIAREVIEVADHLAKAINTCEKHNHPQHKSQLKSLHKLYQELSSFLQKHQIYQVDPVNRFFDPNEHHAIGFIEAPEPEKTNLVAETKRTGWKLRERVLREAFVVIYK